MVLARGLIRIYVTIICDHWEAYGHVVWLDIGTHDALLEATKIVCTRGKSPICEVSSIGSRCRVYFQITNGTLEAGNQRSWRLIQNILRSHRD